MWISAGDEISVCVTTFNTGTEDCDSGTFTNNLSACICKYGLAYLNFLAFDWKSIALFPVYFQCPLFYNNIDVPNLWLDLVFYIKLY